MKNKQEKIFFELEQDEDGYPPAEWESVWASKVGENLYKIDNIPFFVCDISLNDIVKTVNIDGELHFVELKQPSSHSVIRVIIEDKTKRDELRSELKSMGCESELSHLDVLFTVDIPENVSFTKIADYLQEGEDSELWEYQEASIRHNE